MPAYPIELDDEASEQFIGFSRREQLEFKNHLLRLQSDPPGLSRPTCTPPYPAGYQIYQFKPVIDGISYIASIFFHYGDGGVLLIRFFSLMPISEGEG